MARAVWNGAVLAESDECQMVEGNHYFPPDCVNRQYFQPSDTRTVCPWKGTAHYYHLEVDGQLNRDAAWYYPRTKAQANPIEGYVAFWNGVQVQV